MKLSKMPGFGSYGAVVDDFDFENPDDYLELKDLQLKSLVTIVKTHGQNKFKSIVENSRTIFKPRNPNYKWAVKYGAEWTDLVKPDEKSSVSHIDAWGLDLEFEGWSRVSGKKDSAGNFIGAFGDNELIWHTDEPGSYLYYPLVVLYGAAHMNTSATCFLQTVDWYESLGESFRSELDELVAVYDSSKLSYTQSGVDNTNRQVIQTNQKANGSELPLVAVSPGGQVGIRYANMIDGFKGMTSEESAALLVHITKGIFQEKYTYNYWWPHEHGDLMLIDNSVTLHERKIQPGLDRVTELSQRTLYRGICDYVGLHDYTAFKAEQFSSQRICDLQNLNELGMLSSNHYVDHLVKLKNLKAKQMIAYSQKIKPAYKKIILERLKHENN
jgi:alpha-ketoglutarate-dependent taurine dioxygenase